MCLYKPDQFLLTSMYFVSSKMCSLVKCALLLCVAVAVSSHSLGPNDVIFHLYTINNPTVSQPLLPSTASIMTSSFSLSSRTVITIHSFGESVSGNFNAFVVPTHLQSENVNVIAVDWSVGSALYTQGLSEASQCGEIVASFVNILISSFGYSASQVRIVGVGLGGHIAGIAARNIIGNVPHIVALDPSLHGWTHHPDRLSTNDADLVEVLHATAGIMGYDFPLGHIDFYPNGGSFQNGCGLDTSCSHIYSYAFYAESLTAPQNNAARFIGTKCDTYEDAAALRCFGARDATFGGPEVKTSESGIYTFLTNPSPPFARN